MTIQEQALVANWRRMPWASAEAKLNALVDLADQLTDLSKTREGAHSIHANYPKLIEALRKLHDLALDAQPQRG